MSPVAIQAYRSINTILEINGPTLAVDTQPSDATDVAGETVTFGTSGLASASFPEGSSFTPSGTLSYAWYSSTPGSSSWTIVANGTRTNSDGTTTTITGAGTSVLSIANIKFGGDNNNQYKVRVGYNPSGYDGDDFPYNAGTPNAINEPLDSDTALLTVTPTLSISGQPADATGTTETRTLFNVIATCDNPDLIDTITYQWYQDGSALTNGTNVTGAQASQLSITSTEGSHTIYCVVGHNSASPTSVQSSNATFTVENPRIVINKAILDGGGWRSGNQSWGDGTGLTDRYYAPQVTNTENHNINYNSVNYDGSLSCVGQATQTANNGVSNAGPQIQIWAPEQDLDVMIELAGSCGQDYSGSSGGQGGWGVFRITLKQNQEYTLKLGSSDYSYGPKGGGIAGTPNGGVGGGLAVLYKGNEVIAVAGGGGGAGYAGGGGDGGGLNQSGEKGFGRYGGEAGGTVSPHGGSVFTPDRRGGQIYTCPGPTPNSSPDESPQVFPTGLSDCQDYTSDGEFTGCTSGHKWDGTNQQTRNKYNDGGTGDTRTALYPDTANLKRGFRTGDGGRWTGGWGINGAGGAGGAGFRGGFGASGQGHGGGGASGYAKVGTDGLEILRTASGVSRSDAYARVHLYNPNNIPNQPVAEDPSLRDLQWDDPRAPGCKYGWNGTEDQTNDGAYIEGPNGSMSDPRGRNWLGDWSNNASFTYNCGSTSENISYFIFELYIRKLAPRYYNSDGSYNSQYLTANRGAWNGANGARVRKWIAPGKTQSERYNWIRSNTFTSSEWIYDDNTNPTRQEREAKWTDSISDAFRPFEIRFEVELTFTGTPAGNYRRLVYTKSEKWENWGDVKDVYFSSGDMAEANGIPRNGNKIYLPGRALAYTTGNPAGYTGVQLRGIRSNVINLDGDGNSGWNTTECFLQTNGRSSYNLSDDDRRRANGVEFGRTIMI